MQHKFLLRIIKQEMQKQKIPFKNNETFFKLFVPDEPWEAYRSNMSNWLSPGTKDGVIHKHLFITEINEKLGFSPEVWGASDEKQKEAVLRGVENFKAALDKEELLFPWVDEVIMDKNEGAFIDFAKEATLQEIETKTSSIQESFAKTSAKQAFLIALFDLMYERGAYEFVYREIFPHLLDTYDNTIKSKKAHIYASLPAPMYREAFDILNSIRGDSKAETIDLQTSAISNIRRERLSTDTLSKDELKGLLQTFIKCYTKIYVPRQPYSYYPGINLAYMLVLAQYLFPDSLEDIVQEYSVNQIYADVQKSLNQAKEGENKEEKYYASISDIEFQLLSNKKGMAQEVAYVLETLEPSQHLIDQTQRQVGLFFMDVIEKFSKKMPSDLNEFKDLLEIFDAYTFSKKK